MSEAKDAPSNQSQGHSAAGRAAQAVLGLVILLAIVLLANYIVSLINVRVDLTEDKIYTLSDGTRNILERLDTPVSIRYYVSDDPEVMGPGERALARQVEDLLREYKLVGGDMLQIKLLNPEPDTDLEDSALLDGIRPGPSQETPYQYYNGIVVECVDRRELLPFLAARPPTLLEYDLSRAISRVYQDERPKVVIMTGMEVAGGFGGMGGMNQRPTPPWFFYQDLGRDYEVETIPSNSAEVPADADVLVLMHPYDITPEGEYAVDQYLLKGGKVIVMLDSLFFASRFLTPPPNPMSPQPPMGPAPTSNLNRLLETWGVVYSENQVVADMKFATQIMGGQVAPTVLSLTPEAINRDDAVTSMLRDVFMVTPGGFIGDPKEGLTKEVLVRTSADNQLVGTFEADPTQEEGIAQLRKEFIPSGEERALVMRLSGNFDSAFPLGNPANKPTDAAAASPGPEASVPPDPVVPKLPVADDAAPDEAAKETEEEKSEAEGEAAGDAEGGETSSQEEAEADGDEKPAESGGPEEDESDPSKGEEEEKPADESASDEGKPATGDAEKSAEANDEPTAPSAEGASASEAGSETTPAPVLAPADGSLRKSEKEGVVMLFADVDFIYDQFCVQVQNVMGQRFAIPTNSNLSLFQNAIEQMSGDPALIRVRSRSSQMRGFTRLNEILREGEAKFENQLRELEQKQRDAEQKLSELQAAKPEGQEMILTAEQEAEIERYMKEQAEFGRQVREIRKDTRREFESEKGRIKFFNTFFVPIAVIGAGIALALRRRAATAAR